MKLDMWTNEDSQTYYTRGHVDLNEFKSAIDAHEKEEYGKNRFSSSLAGHGWFKAVPDSTGNYKCMYHPSKEGVRGAFKATTSVIY